MGPGRKAANAAAGAARLGVGRGGTGGRPHIGRAFSRPGAPNACTLSGPVDAREIVGAIHTVVHWGLRDMSVHRFEYTTPLFLDSTAVTCLPTYSLSTASTTRDTAVDKLFGVMVRDYATVGYNALPATQNACQSTDFEVRFESAMNLPPNEPPVRLRHSRFRFRSGWTKGSPLAGLPTSPRIVSPPLAACVAHLPQLPSSSLSISPLLCAFGRLPHHGDQTVSPCDGSPKIGLAPLPPCAPSSQSKGASPISSDPPRMMARHAS